jgi:hypothetical protein
MNWGTSRKKRTPLPAVSVEAMKSRLFDPNSHRCLVVGCPKCEERERLLTEIHAREMLPVKHERRYGGREGDEDDDE